MQVLHGCCCGLDIHKRFVVACVLTTSADGSVQKVTRTFSTMTDELLAFLDWLTEVGCTHVAMESTSAYWRPIYNLLEGHLTVLVANAYHIKAVPGRKTDVRDAEWIADLLRHGLLRGSFIPSREQRQLRDLTRYRTHLVEERARVTNRLQMVLEDANVKLAAVVTDVRGVSARAILEALVAGESDPTTLADLARGRLRAKRELLSRAVVGRFTAHHAFLITEHLSGASTKFMRHWGAVRRRSDGGVCGVGGVPRRTGGGGRSSRPWQRRRPERSGSRSRSGGL
jgi:transposase